MSDDRILATWVQNRFDIKSLPNNKSGFELMQEVIKGQDIWYAVYDLSKDSLLSIGSLPDDKSTFTSGRTEGNPIVKGINENKGMIVWTVSDLANNESELYYSFVENNNDWTSTNGESICGNIPGSEINQTIGINSDGDIILSWINVSKDATKRQVMGSVYSNNSWTNCSVLADEPSGSKIRYMDMEFEANYGSLIWSEGRLDTDKDGDLIPMEKINFIKWNSNIKNWDKSTLITILDSNIKEAKEPNIEISNTGKIAVLYQNNEMRGPVRKVNAIYGDMNNTNNWKSDNENVLICDTNKRLYDFDFGFKGGDTLFVIKQENMTNSSFEVNKNIKNGNRFGATNSNLVLRTLMVGGTPTNVKTEDITKQIKDEEDGINVYPNPANDILNISFDNQSRVYSFDIFDSKGKLIQTEHYDVKGNDYSIDVSNLSTGMYFIQYNDNGTKKMKSFVVVR